MQHDLDTPSWQLHNSEGRAWRALSAATYQHAPVAEAYERPATPDLLVVVVTAGECRFESASGGQWRGARHRPGSIGVTAPGVTGTFRWRSDGNSKPETLEILLGPQLVEGTRDELALPTSFSYPDGFSLDDPFVVAIGHAIARSLREGAPCLCADSLAHVLTTHLLAAPTKPAPSLPRGGLNEKALTDVLEYIQAYLHLNPSLADLAAVAYLSPYHFLRMFRRSTGVTPHQYLINTRMQRAARLLETTDSTVLHIADACGYSSQAYFATIFRRTYRDSPIGYRTALRR